MEWQTMALLGAYHGINPGMGWLFAVALGMQRGDVKGVWRALPPIALGHALAVASVLAVAWLAQWLVPPAAMKAIVACSLVTLGGYRLWRHRHPRYGGMRVTFRDLTIWSFLMASAHGAGVMVLPFVMTWTEHVEAAAHGSGHAGHMMATTTAPVAGGLAVAIHTAAYLLVTALVAHVVYRKLGLSLLRTAWINMDWVWAGALVVTGVIVLLA